MKTQNLLPAAEKLPLLIFVFLAFSFTAFSQNTNQQNSRPGKITGKITDAETGETIIGANVVVTGTSNGDATDIDGWYSISSLASGTYSITASYISYGKKTITDINVQAGKATVINITLQSEALGLDEVTVTARAATDSNAGLLSLQRKSLAVQDGLSAEFLGRSGDGNVAAAIRRMIGVSILNGKDVEVFINATDGSKIKISDIDHLDVLPAVNMTYSVTDRTNVRGAFSITLARPEFREISRFQFQDFTGSQIVYGNTDPERTQITNYDLRVETYPAPGELFAVSLFFTSGFPTRLSSFIALPNVQKFSLKMEKGPIFSELK